MSYGGKTVEQWLEECLKHPTSCCHDAHIAAIIAASNDCNYCYKSGKDKGWHVLEDGKWVRGEYDGNRLWLATCEVVYPLILKRAEALQRTELTEHGDVGASKRYMKRVKKASLLLSTSYCNRVHKLLKRMLASK
jgi:hypothetical protein